MTPKQTPTALALGLLLLAVPGIAAPPAAAPPAAAPAQTPAAAAPVKPPESLTYGRFGEVAIYRNTPHPKNVVLFFSGDGGWNLGVVDMARILADMDSLVVGISVPVYVQKLNGSKESCSYAASDLELLSKYVQKTLGLPTYVPPVLVGYSSGATLAYAALAQAPPNTFRGALSLGFCPDLNLVHPFCKGNGIASVPDPKHPGKGLIFQTTDTLEQPWIAFQGTIDQVCDKDAVVRFVAQVKNGETVLLPDVGHGFSKTYKWEPQFRQAYRQILEKSAPARQANHPAGASVSDLPLVEVPAQGGRTEGPLAVVISGDGGWASIDRQVAGALAAKGIPVAGLNSLQYFWTARTPEALSKDLERILRHYLAAWNRQEAILVGYSMGADVLPFAADRLPADLLGKVKLVALLGPSRTANFEFHVAEWLGREQPGLPVLPEVRKLAGHPVLCLHGAQEDDSLCPTLTPAEGRSVELPGAHHFGGDYEALAALILKEAQAAK